MVRSRNRLARPPINSFLAQHSRSVVASHGFSPSDLSGLRVWLETGDYSNIYCHEATGLGNPCEDGEACLGWEDRSGNALHLTEATNGPAYQTPFAAEADAPNGKGRLVFDGSNDILQAASAADWKHLHDGTGGEIFVVAMTTNEADAVLLDTSNALAGAGLWMANYDSSTQEGRFQVAIRNGSGLIAYTAPGEAANLMPVGEWHIFHTTFEGTTNHVYGDGCYLYAQTVSGTPASGNPASALRIGRSGASTFHANKYGALISVARSLTAVERRNVFNYLGLRYGIATGNVACIGDSITSGGFGVATPYPTSLAGRLGRQWRVVNTGASGAETNAIKTNQWDHATNGAKGRRFNYVVYLGGINDIRSPLAATNIWNDSGRMKDTFDAIIAQPGTRLVACTLVPNKGDNAYDAARQAEIDALNTLIRNYVASNANCYLVDLASILANQADPFAMHPAYDFDHLHPNQTGTDAIAAAVADRLLQIGLSL